MIMSDVGWTLWAAIQARISSIDYDFMGWAEERWARAGTALDGPGLRGLAGGRGRRRLTRSGAQSAAVGIDEDVGRDDRRDPLVEHVDLEAGALGRPGRQVACRSCGRRCGRRRHCATAR